MLKPSSPAPAESPGTGPAVWSSHRSAAAPVLVACTTGAKTRLSLTSPKREGRQPYKGKEGGRGDSHMTGRRREGRQPYKGKEGGRGDSHIRGRREGGDSHIRGRREGGEIAI